MNSSRSNLLDMRNLQDQVKKAFCYQKLFWPFTAWINCYSDLKNLANSRPSASNFKFFSRSLERFFLTLGQNNFGNKIPHFLSSIITKTWDLSNANSIVQIVLKLSHYARNSPSSLANIYIFFYNLSGSLTCSGEFVVLGEY